MIFYTVFVFIGFLRCISVYHITTFTYSDYLKMPLGMISSDDLMKRSGFSVERGGGMFEFLNLPAQTSVG